MNLFGDEAAGVIPVTLGRSLCGSNLLDEDWAGGDSRKMFL